VKTQVAVVPAKVLPIIALPALIDPPSYLHRAWPPTVLAIALIINAAWIGWLGYWTFKLGELGAMVFYN